MNTRIYIVTALALVFFISYGSASAVTTLITQQGGTGTTTPSGILYGDNGSTNHVNTVTIGSNLTFSGGTLSATGGSSFAYPFPANATSTLLNFNGNASTTQVSAGRAYFGGTATTTIDGTGNIVIPSGSNLTITGKSDGCATFATGVLNSTGVACGSGGTTTGLATTSPTQNNTVLVYNSAGAGSAYGVATTSLTATGVLSLSQPISVIGSSASTLSIPSGTTNSVLTTNGIDVVGWTKVSLTAQVSGTLPYANGGTGTTTAPVSQLLYGGATAYQSVATSSFTPSAEFTIGGTLGALVGGANSTLTIATNGVALTKLAQIAANSILGNITSGTANVTAFATSSLGIALGDTTGTLAANRGGTGQSSYTTGDVLYASNSSTLTKLGVGTAGQVLGVVAGIPAWVATSTSGGGSGTVGSGTTGQFPFYNANGTTLTATSTLFLAQNGNVGIASTTPGFPLSVNGNAWITGSMVHIGAANCGFPIAVTPNLGAEICGNDNTQGGVILNISNNNAGANAYTGINLNNDQSNSNSSNYAGGFLNSSGHTYTGFGTAAVDAGQLQWINTLGEVTFTVATATPAFNFFNWTKGINSTDEIMRLNNAGNLGLGTTTPWAKLSALLGSDFTAKAPSYAIAIASSSAGTATTTLFTVESSGKVSVPIELTTPYSATPTVSTNGDVGIDSTADQLKYQSSGATQVLSPVLARSFTYATSTWAGTTTYPIASVIVPYTFAKISCFTDAGTVNVDIYDGTNRTNLITASSTNGITALTTNNNMTAGKKVYVEMGTPATSPKNLACDLTYSFNAQ